MNPPSLTPRISIVIPAYNASDPIKECLDHVFSSEFKDFEVVIVEDGSTDDTLEKISAYSIRVLKNERNRGPAASRNRGADEAKADVILFIDSDVLIPPHLLGRILAFFDTHPEVSLLQGRYGDTPYYRNLFSQYKHFVFSFRGLTDVQTYVNYVHTACVAIRKNVFKKFRFDEGLKRREDVEFGLRLSEGGHLIYADKALVVGHKKKYDFFSFSSYQFHAARELARQHLAGRSKNLTREFNSPRHSLYKKLWLLRPLLCLVFICNLIWLGWGGGLFPGFAMAGVSAASFLLESRFRWYLFRVAPLSVSLAAWWLYFYDGLLIGLGVLSGLWQVIKKVPSDATV